jgi:acyl-CoA thioesterase FadM
MTTRREALESSCLASGHHDLVCFTISASWATPGEARIGYVSIMRLVESIRELHWQRDVLSATTLPIDSITRSLSVDFLAPVEPRAAVMGRYRVDWCRRRSYGLEVSLDSPAGVPLVRARLVSVFYDPVAGRSTRPSASVTEALTNMAVGADLDRNDLTPA